MAFEPPEQFNIADYFLDARVQEGKGERPAVLTAGAAFTYREIEALANQFGHVLREAGVQPEQRVMIALPDGPAFVAALFGALKIGAVVVMVNPQLKPDAIAYFYRYTRARVIVAHRDTVGAFRAAARGARHLRTTCVVGEEEWDARLAHAPAADVLFQKITKFRPTILINVPTMINQMVSHPTAATRDLSCLRLTTSAGEPLPVELYHRWKDTFGVELLDGLGTAEMWHIFISNRPGLVRPGTLGPVVPGFEVKVCDADGRQLPDGEVGCLWVRGDSRAICYWQQMDKTREAFRGEWYVSGDMIRRDPEGYITYCGRVDDMLKVSGKWLSPQEAENCLLRHPAVKDVAVVRGGCAGRRVTH